MARPLGATGPLLELEQAAALELGLEQVGARVLALLVARAAGVELAPTWVLPAEAFREALRRELPPGHELATLVRYSERPAGLERAARAHERLLAAELGDALSEELSALVRQRPGRWRVAVSPTVADEHAPPVIAFGAELVVEGSSEALGAAVRRLWAAAVEEQCLAELRRAKLRGYAVALSLQWLPGCYATACLRRDATEIAGPRQGFVVDVLDPLAPAVLEGGSLADELRLDAAGALLEQRVAHRARRGGARSPSELELAELARLGERLLEPERAPTVALRLALSGERPPRLLALLRRPLSALDGAWSRAAFGDATSGVPTPLTRSLARDYGEPGLRHAFRALGIALPKGQPLVHRSLERPYLELQRLATAVAELPGVSAARLTPWLSVPRSSAGGGEPRLEHGAPRASLPGLGLTSLRLRRVAKRVELEAERFDRDAEQTQRWLAEMELPILPDDSLKTTLLEVYGSYQRTSQLLATCELASLACHVAVGALIARVQPLYAETLTQTLIAGVGELDTLAPAFALFDVAELLRQDAAASASVQGGARQLSLLPSGPGRRAVALYLETFGDRALAETELRGPRWREEPAPVFALLAALLAERPLDPQRRLSQVRVASDKALAGLERSASRAELLLLRALLEPARRLLRQREHVRAWLGRTLGMLRRVVVDHERRLRRRDRTLERDAAFFLTREELLSAARSLRVDLAGLARLRRAGWEQASRLPDPPESFVGAPPWLPPAPRGVAVLHGLAGAPGLSDGVVRTVGPRGEGAELVRAGDVVVCRAPDTGLVPLLLLASALVTELGGPLAPLAVAARELGVVAVLGVTAATRTLRDGERVRVDGTRGLVERLGA